MMMAVTEKITDGAVGEAYRNEYVGLMMIGNGEKDDNAKEWTIKRDDYDKYLLI